MVSALLRKKADGKNRYFITFFVEEDAPMVSPVLLMVLNTVDEIGTLVYSSLGDDYFSGNFDANNIRTLDVIITTNIDESELYTYFSLFYIEKINVVNLTRNKLKSFDYYFADQEYVLHLMNLKTLLLLFRTISSLSKSFKIEESDFEQITSWYTKTMHAFNKMNNKLTIRFQKDFDRLYHQISEIYNGQRTANEKLCAEMQNQITSLVASAYPDIRGKHIVSVFKSDEDCYIGRIHSFVNMLNKSTFFILLIDLTTLTKLKEHEVKDLIEIKHKLESQNMELGIIVDGLRQRNILNIFDAIRPIEDFSVYWSENEAIFGIFKSEGCYEKLNQRLKDVQ